MRAYFRCYIRYCSCEMALLFVLCIFTEFCEQTLRAALFIDAAVVVLLWLILLLLLFFVYLRSDM